MTGVGQGHVVDGRYEMTERLSRGEAGTGEVWRARDMQEHREVALRKIPPGDEDALREARALAGLTHPRLVRVQRVVTTGPHPWAIIELLPGPSLLERLAAGPLPWTDVVRHGRDVLAALRAVHTAGVLHRDLSPGNVLLRGDGSVALTGFGSTGGAEFTAPERLRGAPDHPSADLWSLGMLLYVLAEGRNPLRRAGDEETRAAVLEGKLPPPQRSGPLAEALGTVLAADPAARPDAEQLDALLARAQAQTDAEPPAVPAAKPSPYAPAPPYGPSPSSAPPLPPPYAPPQPSGRPPRPPAVPPVSAARRGRNALVAIVVSVVLLAAVGLTAAMLSGGSAEDDAAAGGRADGQSGGNAGGEERTEQRIPAHATGAEGLTVRIGDPDAPHTLVLYEDLRCPACAAFEQTMGTEIRRGIEAGTYHAEYVYGTFLDDNLGGSGSLNALGALGAALDVSPEAFMAYKDALYSARFHPSESTDDFADDLRLLQIAGTVPELADNARFARDVTAGAFAEWALAMSRSFDAAPGVTGTPTLRLDGEIIDTPATPAGLRAALREPGR